MIRDDELKRLEQYAKSMGITVEFKQHKSGDPDAAWIDSEPNKTIVLYKHKSDTKTDLVLCFIHELAHHLEYVHNKTQNKELTKALLLEDARKELDKPLDKKLRKLIYEDELKASNYRGQIIKELDIRLKPDIIKLDIMLDLYHYRTYYETGFYPTIQEMKDQRKLLREQLKKENK